MTTVQDAVDPTTIEGRVDAGYRFLNEKVPGWQDWIRLKDLKLSSAHRCVLAQLDYHPHVPAKRGSDAYERVTAGLGLNDTRARELGFMADGGEWGSRNGAEYSELEREWRRRLQGHRTPLRRRIPLLFRRGRHV